MKKYIYRQIIFICCLMWLGACQQIGQSKTVDNTINIQQTISDPNLSEFQKSLVLATKKIIDPTIKYYPQYIRLDYPNGDVPAGTGVCTDVVIRAYRALGIDLQELVHIDMKKRFQDYPRNWNLKNPDPNIDHRRVPNLMTFFKKYAEVKPITKDSKDYTPGDIVCWKLDNGMTHIGIVIDDLNTSKTNRLIVHNIGGGQVADDILFQFEIIGHYYYAPNITL